MSGTILSIYYRKTSNTSVTGPHLIVYIILILNAFWSLRSGIFILNTLIVYTLVIIACCTQGGNKLTKQVRRILRPAAAATITFSFLAAAFRV
ncbi:hypothetical protein D3C85_1135530 [compost metagenome]